MGVRPAAHLLQPGPLAAGPRPVLPPLAPHPIRSDPVPRTHTASCFALSLQYGSLALQGARTTHKASRHATHESGDRQSSPTGMHGGR